MTELEDKLAAVLWKLKRPSQDGSCWCINWNGHSPTCLATTKVWKEYLKANQPGDGGQTYARMKEASNRYHYGIQG